MKLAESTVLVVDDEPVLRLTFAVLLQRVGARVLVAGDGVEALQTLESQHVDVILTDKLMPKIGGLELLQELRERDVMTPAILFVNGVVPEDVLKMQRLRVLRTVTKPIHPQDLVRLLDEVLEPITAQ